ncbi:hypothetical protein [Acidocella sp.]|uniref:hypothetical protein n=1 Tax=Acidocella sp. TaxID=50710 RepID=UPI0026064D13|nr:hypothetical protein [Acidocella sp.]
MAKAPFPIRVRARINELEKMIKTAQAELDELRVAERVLNRLASDGCEENEDVTSPENKAKPAQDRGDTIGSRIVGLLEAEGAMTTADILKKLQDNWRADLTLATVSSTLTRTKAQNLIVKIDDKWDTPKREEGANEAPSNPEKESDTNADLLKFQPPMP